MLIGGCGEGSEASSNLTKAEFVEQADAVCAKREKIWREAGASYAKEIEAKGAANTPVVQREILATTLEDTLLPALDDQREELEGLGSPQGREDQVEKMLETLSTGIHELEDKGLEAVPQTQLATFQKQAESLGVTCPIP